MNPGVKVKSKAYPEKGIGIVLNNKTVFNKQFVEVFFGKVKESICLESSDLAVIDSPQKKIANLQFSLANKFYLRFLKERIKSDNTHGGFQAVGGFKILPLPHQLLVVSFMLSQFKPKVLIADEVGLGKTIEAALAFSELKVRGIAKRVLVIAPSGLCEQWREELKLKFFEDFIIYDKETIRSLKKLHGEDTNVWTLSDNIITSIDFIKPRRVNNIIDSNLMKSRQWHNQHVFESAVTAGFDVVIFDEAHKLTKGISGEETARYKVGKALADVTPVMMLLTATPHQGDTAKFKNLLNLIDPYLFYKNSDVTPENVKKVTVRNNKRAVVDFAGNRLFKQRITSLYAIERSLKEDKAELDLYNEVTEYVSLFYNLAQQQNNRTMMFLLLLYQRMVSSSSRAILKSLTNRLEVLQNFRRRIIQLEQTLYTEEDINIDDIDDLPSEKQLMVLEKYIDINKYLHHKQYLDAEITELTKCIHLAQQAVAGRNDLKFRKLLEVINEFKIRENNPNLKFVIFTEFVETQKYLQESLESLGYSTAIINGSLSTEARIEQKQKFRESAQFLISTDAGGEGINLQICWVMINYDLPWNPMRLEQRIGRIDRIGQEHDVKVINFQLTDTVEQRVRDVIENKLNTIATEFNNSEDKLADILSTLNDEFSFEGIYIDAIIKKEQDAKSLEELAQRICQRAKEVLLQGELTLPFTELDQKFSISELDLVKQRNKVRNFLETYLNVNGRHLIPYKNKPGVYYFEDPETGKRITNIIFDQQVSLDNENLELISFNHPYLLQIINKMEEDLLEETTAKMLVKEKRFAGCKGLLFIYKFILTNYIDRPKTYVLSCFIDNTGTANNRISRYFDESEQFTVTEFVGRIQEFDYQLIFNEAERIVDGKAEVLYYENSQEINQEANDVRLKMNKYYADKEKAINNIGVENIKKAKLIELQREMLDKEKELEQRCKLIPYLELEQIAYVEFCE